ncbi:MAG: RNHCP domain-containing protein [Planctomycetes bacterium]|nr:RNHCP domain-containing protein [Planctomycetota bacterium]
MEASWNRKNFIGQGNDAFRCLHCGAPVSPLQTGFRNHCPECLWSRHVDHLPGDRAQRCGGLMEPIALEGSESQGWDLVHRCLQCGAVRRNRAAVDDPVQPDRWERLIELSTRSRPLKRPRRKDKKPKKK